MNESTETPVRPHTFIEDHADLQQGMLLALLAALVVFTLYYGRKKK
jgi:hypothetical protein